MTATTAMYLELQRLFRERADQDLATLEAHVRQIEQVLGRSAPKVPTSIIRSFAKNARNIRQAALLQLLRHSVLFTFANPSQPKEACMRLETEALPTCEVSK